MKYSHSFFQFEFANFMQLWITILPVFARSAQTSDLGSGQYLIFSHITSLSYSLCEYLGKSLFIIYGKLIGVCCHGSTVVFYLRISNEWTNEWMFEWMNEWREISSNSRTGTKSNIVKKDAMKYQPKKNPNDWIKMNYGALHIAHSKSYYLNELTQRP